MQGRHRANRSSEDFIVSSRSVTSSRIYLHVLSCFIGLVLVIGLVNYYDISQYVSSTVSTSTGHKPISSRSMPIDFIHQQKETPEVLDQVFKKKMSLEETVKQERIALEENKKRFPANYDNSTMHLIFSMSCDQGHRILLTSVLQYTATQAGQRGPITQILSGCSDEEKRQVLKEQPHLYYDFRIHFTPSYSPHPEEGIDDSYYPYNKPFSLRHFLQNAHPPVQHEIMALVDGDFVFFQPLEVNTGRNVTQYYHGGERDPSEITDTVKDGMAIAQDWSIYMGAGWFGGDRDKVEKICPGKPCYDVTEQEAREYYSGTGPPYIMTRNDMFKFIDDYCHFTVEGRKVDKGWMTEMFGYAAAAANHGIKHTILTHLGITHPNYQGPKMTEYWNFLDGELALAENPCKDPFDIALPLNPPIGLHYCQSYGLFPDGEKEGGHFFYKYGMPRNVIQCDKELFVVPPADAWTTANVLFDEDPGERSKKKHEVWVECTLTKVLNHVLRKIKEKTCPQGYNTYQGLALVKEKEEEEE